MSVPPLERHETPLDPIIRENQARALQLGLWFDDGNIILIAENMPFKVHKSILSMKGEVFRDMFSFPQPELQEETEFMDGIPVVRMSDSWHELCIILHALYDGYRAFGTRSQIPFGVICAFLRLGTKYNITDFQEVAISRLQETFPSSLYQFQNQFPLYFCGREVVYKTSDRCPIHMSTTEAIEVVNLARAFNIPSVLPAAFYVCSRLSPKVLMEGIVYPDGRRSVLSPADLLRCWNGQQELDRRYAVALQDLRNVIAGDFCEDEDECSEAKKNHDEKEMCSTMGCCLASASWLDEDLADEVTLCDSCTQARVSSWKEFRSDIWNALPEIFDLKDANEAS